MPDLGVGEQLATTRTFGWWLQGIGEAARLDVDLVRVPNDVLPAALALIAAPAQHLLVSVARAQQQLGW